MLKELYNQRAFEFYLEGKRWRTSAVPGVGDEHDTGGRDRTSSPDMRNVGTQTCYPLPRVERDNNPNMH